MPKINFTYALKRFFPGLKTLNVAANNAKEVVEIVEKQYPGIKDYLVDERGQLREHVNIFIGNELIEDKVKLSDKVKESDEVFIMQALSGG